MKNLVNVENISHYYSKNNYVLKNININFEYGKRYILTGDNGAGKTTLLKLLGGKFSVREGDIKILGRTSFFDAEINQMRSYIGSGWGKTIIPFTGVSALTSDIRVDEMMKKLQEKYSKRRDKLFEILEINENWRMNEVSDGQRKRVQIMLNLLKPFKLLLLDEITTDLDIVTRRNFLNYLKIESETRNITIIYSTHIFEGLQEWGTHLIYLNNKKIKYFKKMKELDQNLADTIYNWIKEDKVYYKKKEIKQKKIIPDGNAGGYAPGRFRDY